MAIKTKKISELDTLKDINGTYAVVGVGDGTTGKITLEQIKKFVDAHKTPTTEQVSEVSKQDLEVVSSEVKKVADEVAAVKKSSEQFVTKYTNMVYTQTQKNKFYEDEINSLVTRITALESFVQSFETRITELEKTLKEANDRIATLESCSVQVLQEDNSLEDKVKALESFVHALQKDGYLTLAEIKKAAAEFCPCGEETHNGEQIEQPTE